MLESQRLVLRKPTADDAATYFTICNSEFVLRYNAMSKRTLAEIKQLFSEKAENMRLLQLKENGQVIGAVFIEDDSVRWDVNSKEISYFLDKQYSRQGYMKEALHSIIDYLFDTEHLVCVAARCFAPNVASQKLLESLGFCRNGVIPACVKGYKDIIFDDMLYSVFKEQWK